MTQLATLNFTPPDDAVIAMWLHGKRPHTTRAYRVDIARFRSFVNCTLAEVTLKQIQDFGDSITLNEKTKHRIVAAVRSLFGFASRLGYLHVNPCLMLKLESIDRSLKAERILSEESVHAMFDNETGRNRVMLRFLYASGVRVAELTGLRWRDCTPTHNGGVVTVTGKRNRTRAINIPEPIWSELMSLRNGDSEDARPFGLHQSTIWHIVNRAARKAGLTRGTTHGLRHSCASHALHNGADIALIQHQLGHASIATTGQYLHALPNDGAGNYLRL